LGFKHNLDKVYESRRMSRTFGALARYESAQSSPAAVFDQEPRQSSVTSRRQQAKFLESYRHRILVIGERVGVGRATAREIRLHPPQSSRRPSTPPCRKIADSPQREMIEERVVCRSDRPSGRAAPAAHRTHSVSISVSSVPFESRRRGSSISARVTADVGDDCQHFERRPHSFFCCTCRGSSGTRGHLRCGTPSIADAHQIDTAPCIDLLQVAIAGRRLSRRAGAGKLFAEPGGKTIAIAMTHASAISVFGGSAEFGDCWVRTLRQRPLRLLVYLERMTSVGAFVISTSLP